MTEAKKLVTITITETEPDCSCSCAHGDAIHEGYIIVDDDGGTSDGGEWCDGDYMYNDAKIAAEERAEEYRKAGHEVAIVSMKDYEKKAKEPKMKPESATKTAERAAEAALKREHKTAEELYLLAAATASASGSRHMSQLARQWDRDAARQKRLSQLGRNEP